MSEGHVLRGNVINLLVLSTIKINKNNNIFAVTFGTSPLTIIFAISPFLKSLDIATVSVHQKNQQHGIIIVFNASNRRQPYPRNSKTNDAV